MTAPAPDQWMDANRRYLMAALAVIKMQLELCRTASATVTDCDRDTEMRAARAEVQTIARTLEQPAPIDVMCALFGLTPFERDILLLCAGVEFDKNIADACEAIQGNPTPTFGLALVALPNATWGPLAPDAPLRRWNLIEVGGGITLASRPLRIDEYVLHALLGLETTDERLFGFVEPVTTPKRLSESQQKAAERASALWLGELPGPVLSLCGSAARTLRAAAETICDRCGLNLYAIDAADIPDLPAEQWIVVRLWERHAALTSSALLVELASDTARTRAATFASRLRTPTLVAAAEPVRLRNRTAVRVDINRPLFTEQVALWRDSLGSRASRFDAEIETVASQFQLDGDDIDAVAAQLLALPGPNSERHGSSHARDENVVSDQLWQTCRIQTRPRLDQLAQYIEPRADWDHLVVGDRSKQLLREIAIHVHHRARVYDSWGFARNSDRGLGISALFSGPSGTGKTTAAEVLAGELQLDLYRIDLSTVVSKYIGETEKNLRRVFDAAEGGGAILLFDEADALFGKRSEVKDSHDRYANMEVSYLLQRMEAYRGLAILTTNLRDSLDSAFIRRLRFVVEFPFPTVEQRARIWRRVFPSDAPLATLDIDKLARLNLSGGTIRNMALAGAFLAAEQGVPISMTHLRAAARNELIKLERTVPERELKDWI
ncbi:MAG: ATP-binding protein [Proteobacteria bacterium]|nr:ATP-binding protein [Pseudomonadota bacterium]